MGGHGILPCPSYSKGDFMIYYVQTIMRWLWLPVLLLLIATVLTVPYQRRKKFFHSINLIGYDDKPPRYLGKRTINTHLKRLRFKSRIPLGEWEKAKPDMEMFYRKKVYKMEQSKADIRIIHVYLIHEALPSFIRWDDSYMEAGEKFAIGEGYKDKVIWDASAYPHGLIAGATGSGKTGILRCLIHQAIHKKWNVQVLDFKGGGDYASVEQKARETQKFHDLEAGYGPFIINNPEEALHLLLALTIEVKGRLEKFKEAGVSNITEYNARRWDYFVPWLVVIDEVAELLDGKPKDKAEKEMYTEIDHLLRTLARTSRAAGVHLLLGFIRPSADVLDGQIKNNLLWRACGYFADPAASRIVLDNDKATELPPEIKGRFIVGDEETQVYYLPIPNDSGKGNELTDDGGTGGEAEREPPEPPAAEGGAT